MLGASGKKYDRTIFGKYGGSTIVDVYRVLVAFAVLSWKVTHESGEPGHQDRVMELRSLTAALTLAGEPKVTKDEPPRRENR